MTTHCEHLYLHILAGDNKTTCRRCGRDFYLYADVDPAIEIAELNLRIDELKKEIEQAWKICSER